MSERFLPMLAAIYRRLRSLLGGSGAIALLPAVMLGGFWLGGEQMLIILALGFPICLLFVRASPFSSDSRESDMRVDESAFEKALDTAVRRAQQTSRRTGCVLLALDDYAIIRERYGYAATNAMMTLLTERMASVLRSRDTIRRIEDNLVAVCVAPVRQLDLGIMLQMAARLQAVMQEPIVIDATTVYVTASVGLTLDMNAPEMTGTGLLAGASTALAEARRHGPSSMRAYSHEMQLPIITCSHSQMQAAREALENGQIQPWYQPQISTDTGQVSGFEALARWTHPEHGLISPAEFLPILEQAGAMERLSEVMLYNALSALKAWDAAGLNVPQIGVNFSAQELRNPNLVKKIEWELDRFNLAANRLSIEILETVIALSPDDIVVRNIAGLSSIGCQIDLDDFGTGHASISSIRRFAVSRLKIDRSFVMKLDSDPEQQRMISAILTMAEQLGLTTLAEGVETAAEHAMLAQLGCGHVQGYSIGRPLPLDQTIDWVRAHRARIKAPPAIGRHFG